jgi:hypothetical protein
VSLAGLELRIPTVHLEEELSGIAIYNIIKYGKLKGFFNIDIA